MSNIRYEILVHKLAKTWVEDGMKAHPNDRPP